MRGLSLSTILNITSLPLQASANAAPAKGLAAGKGGLLAFLNLLMGQAGDAQGVQGGNDLAAKLAAILKGGPTDKTQLTALLQKLFPDATADQLQQAVAEIQATPAASDIQPSLTSDLSASLATNLQDGGDVMANLKAKFDALMQDGPITPDKLAQFRKDAVDALKAQGLDNFSIDKALVTLTADIGDKLTTPLAAQLSMPVPPQAVASAQASADADDDNTIEGLNATAPAAGNTDALAASLQSDAQPQAAQADTAAAAAKPEPTGLQSSASSNAGIQQQQPAPDASAATKPLPSAAAHIFVMNSAQDNAGSNADSGQQMFQGSAGSGASLTGAMTATAEASPQGFVNYMNSNATQATQTTQQVAVQIVQNASNGATTFTMQLEPAELGRLEVRLKFDRDGGMKAHLIADKPETLSLLRQDQAQMHRILQQAGINADDSSLSFDLRQQGQQPGADQSYTGAGQPAGAGAAANANDYLSAKISVEAMGYIRQDGVNIMV